MEIGSFLSPKAIPQVSGIGKLVEALANRTDVHFSALVPSLKGTKLALKHGIRGVIYVVSASKSHNHSNVRRSRTNRYKTLIR